MLLAECLLEESFLDKLGRIIAELLLLLALGVDTSAKFKYGNSS